MLFRSALSRLESNFSAGVRDHLFWMGLWPLEAAALGLEVRLWRACVYDFRSGCIWGRTTWSLLAEPTRKIVGVCIAVDLCLPYLFGVEKMVDSEATGVCPASHWSEFVEEEYGGRGAAERWRG